MWWVSGRIRPGIRHLYSWFPPQTQRGSEGESVNAGMTVSRWIERYKIIIIGSGEVLLSNL